MSGRRWARVAGCVLSLLLCAGIGLVAAANTPHVTPSETRHTPEGPRE